MIPFDLDALTELIARDGRVVALFVTGSHAEGRADEHSDVDLLAVAAHLPLFVNEIAALDDASVRRLGETRHEPGACRRQSTVRRRAPPVRSCGCRSMTRTRSTRS